MTNPPRCPHCGEAPPFTNGFTCESCGRSWAEMEVSNAIIIPAGELTAKHIGRRMQFYPWLIDEKRYWPTLVTITPTIISHLEVFTEIVGEMGCTNLQHSTPVTILPEEGG